MPGPPVVIVGLASVVGLQTARLFAARGVRVIGIAGSLRHFAARTRVCDRIIEADVHTMAFLDALEALGPQLPSRAVVVPCTDQAVLITAKHRDRLAPWYDVSLSPYDVMHQLADKGRFAQLADELGMETLRIRVLRSAADAELAAADLRFPVVLKPTSVAVLPGHSADPGGLDPRARSICAALGDTSRVILVAAVARSRTRSTSTTSSTRSRSTPASPSTPSPVRGR